MMILSLLLACSSAPAPAEPTPAPVTPAPAEPTPAEPAPSPATPTADWEGVWTLQGSSFDAGTVEIKRSSGALLVSLSVASGAHTGEVSGVLHINKDKAEVKEEGCTLKMEKTENVLKVQEVECAQFHGAGVNFEGTYGKGAAKEGAFSLLKAEIVTSQAQEDAVWKLVGDKRPLFEVFQLVEERPDLDGTNARVRSGAIRGLFTISEAIVMVTPDNKVWAAALSPEDDKLYYFTTEAASKQALPKTIEDWRSRFTEKQVVYGQ